MENQTRSDTKMTGKEIARTCGLAIVAGLLAAASFPPVGIALLLLPTLWLLFAAIEGRTVRQATYTGMLFGMTFFGAGLHWFVNLFGTAAIALWAIAAIFPAIFCGLYTFLHKRLPTIPAPILVAIVWTGIEFFRSEWMRPNFGFFGLGYAVVNVPFFAWFAQLLGSFGLTFGIVALIVWIREGWKQKPKRTHWHTWIVVAWLAVFALPHSVPTPDETKKLNVRVVQAMSEDDEAMLAEAHKPGNLDVIILPEYAFLSDPRTEPKRWNHLTEIACTQNAYLIYGGKNVLDKQDERAFENTAWLLDPQGQIIGSHVKNHTVHFINDGRAGQTVRAWQTERGRFGIAICFDFDFTDVARRLVQDGAEVFLIPSNNPAEWGEVQHLQHRQMFQMRAVENGRWLATADTAGNTFIVAPDGQITAQFPRLIESGSVDAVIGLRTNHTIYTLGGWIFAPLCTFALPVLILVAWQQKRRHAQSPIT